jgi:hypothetical protein
MYLSLSLSLSLNICVLLWSLEYNHCNVNMIQRRRLYGGGPTKNNSQKARVKVMFTEGGDDYCYCCHSSCKKQKCCTGRRHSSVLSGEDCSRKFWDFVFSFRFFRTCFSPPPPPLFSLLSLSAVCLTVTVPDVRLHGTIYSLVIIVI